MATEPIIAVVGISVMLSVSAGAVNLLTNPSFEDGSGTRTFSVSIEFGGADAFALTSPSSEIPGWVWEQSDGTNGGAEWLQETAGDLFGTDGSHLLYLDSNQSVQWQDTATASAGDEFRFDFNAAAWARGQDNTQAEGGDSTIFLEYNYRDAGGIQRFGAYVGTPELVAPGNGSAGAGGLTWINGSYVFEIPADYATDFNFVVTNTGGILLDELAISIVPEPSAAMLIGLGLMALAGRRSRR
ncbi:MAG: hypothetical protein ACI8XO_001926 [Verrucomicrobiales bacterium]|jgi:hypothetical protein